MAIYESIWDRQKDTYRKKERNKNKRTEQKNKKHTKTYNHVRSEFKKSVKLAHAINTDYYTYVIEIVYI